MKWACVVRQGGVGDNLIASSVFPSLRAKYGRLEVISREPNHVVYENNPHIDKLTVWPENEAPEDALTWARYMHRRGYGYDFYANLAHSCEITLALMEGQTAFWWSDAMRRYMCGHSYVEYVHRICGVPFDEPQIGFFPTHEEMNQAWKTAQKIRQAHQPLIAWCVSGSRIDKIYPYSHFVIARLISELNAIVVMLGAPGKDFEITKQIQEQVIKQNGSDKNLHQGISPDPKNPSWPVRRILSFLRVCDIVISPDTGPPWSVAMEEQHKIMLLSHASPLNITHKWRNTITLHASQEAVSCWPCHRLQDNWETCRKHEAANAAACMADISAQKVIQAVKTVLSGKHFTIKGDTK